jgi:hypothetical protein
LVIEGDHPYYFIWEYDYLLNRTYTSRFNHTYETANNIYWVSSGAGVNEFGRALKENKDGYAIVYNRDTLDFAENNGLKQIDNYLRWRIYRWGDF